MIDYSIIQDKPVALLICNTEKENDVHVYLGKIIISNNQYIFINEEKKWNVSLNADELKRLQIVDDDVKEIFLNADYFIALSMANLPDDSNEGFTDTGLNWNEE